MSTQSHDDRSLRGLIGAAEVAASEEDWETAEKALLEALSAARKKKDSQR